MSGRWVTVVGAVWCGGPEDADEQERRMIAGLNESGARLDQNEIRSHNPYAVEGWEL